MALIKSNLVKSTMEWSGGNKGCSHANAYEGESKSSIKNFYCYGKSEENDKVVNKITRYKAGKDYIFTSNQSSEHFLHYLDNKLDKYEILNSQLQAEVGKICLEYSKDNDNHFETHRKAMKEYRKHMKEHKRIIEEHRKIAEESRKIAKAARKFSSDGWEKSKDPEKENYIIIENPESKKWNWTAFWTGIAVASLILGLVLILVKLFRKKN